MILAVLHKLYITYDANFLIEKLLTHLCEPYFEYISQRSSILSLN